MKALSGHPWAVILGAIGLVILLATPSGAVPGALDTTFGGDGKVTTNFSSRADTATAIAIQDDGQILVAGGSGFPRAAFALARYDLDGSLDTSFGDGGKVTTNFTSGQDAAWGVAIQDDGKIVAAGDAGLGTGNSSFAVVRYNEDGTLDTTFGDNGKVTTQFTGRDDPVAGLVVTGTGPNLEIIVAGGAAFDGANPRMALARYDENGDLDSTFGGDGKVTTDFTDGLDYANAVIIHQDGVVAAGLARPDGSSSRFALARYNDDGSLDTAFGGGDGKVVTSFLGDGESGQNLAVQADDRIVLAGEAGGQGNVFAVARYNDDGTLDDTFGGDGRVTTNFTSGFDAAWDVVLQADGSIVAAGEAGGSGGRFALARYDDDGSLDTSFGGDGKVVTNFTRRADFAYGVARQDTGEIVLVGGAGWGTSNPTFAAARYQAA